MTYTDKYFLVNVTKVNKIGFRDGADCEGNVTNVSQDWFPVLATSEAQKEFYIKQSVKKFHTSRGDDVERIFSISHEISESEADMLADLRFTSVNDQFFYGEINFQRDKETKEGRKDIMDGLCHFLFERIEIDEDELDG